ncbi:MAG: hypothetical protein MJE63_25705, partial [Proteobacteria bacterium]|nr:hypothetical protein [Pseudomonadota bacterium]
DRLSEKDTLKVIAQSSVRASTAEEMKYAYDTTGQNSDFEKMNSYELRWERKQNAKLWFAISGFLSNHSVVAWDNASSSVKPLGDIDICGIEFEAIHKTDKTKVTFSHGYTKLLNFKLNDSDTQSFISSEPYGEGDDLASWHNHVTKLVTDYRLNSKVLLNSSLNAYWGLPGGQDFANHRQTINPDGYVSGFDKPFQPSVYLNFGLIYDHTENVRFDARLHDVLGVFDEDLNKRNKMASNSKHETSGYRIISPALSFSLKVRF